MSIKTWRWATCVPLATIALLAGLPATALAQQALPTTVEEPLDSAPEPAASPVPDEVFDVLAGAVELANPGLEQLPGVPIPPLTGLLPPANAG